MRYAQSMDVNSRFWAKVDKSDECWMWEAGCINTGYGAFHPAHGQTVLAHRWVYEQEVGPIPSGMVVDHECHNDTECAGGWDCPHRKCVRPSHLTLKTRGENLLASHQHNSKKTHCPRGHEYTPENTRVQAGRNSRSCRECARIRDRQPNRLLQRKRRRALNAPSDVR